MQQAGVAGSRIPVAGLVEPEAGRIEESHKGLAPDTEEEAGPVAEDMAVAEETRREESSGDTGHDSTSGRP